MDTVQQGSNVVGPQVTPVMVPVAYGRYVTINKCADIRPFTGPALRDMRFKAFDRTNSRGEKIKGNGTGPAGVWVKIGAKVLVDLDALDAWTENHKILALNEGAKG